MSEVTSIFNFLPSGIWYRCLKYLDVKSKLNFGAVCKDFQCILSCPDIQQDISTVKQFTQGKIPRDIINVDYSYNILSEIVHISREMSYGRILLFKFLYCLISKLNAEGDNKQRFSDLLKIIYISWEIGICRVSSHTLTKTKISIMSMCLPIIQCFGIEMVDRENNFFRYHNNEITYYQETCYVSTDTKFYKVMADKNVKIAHYYHSNSNILYSSPYRGQEFYPCIPSVDKEDSTICKKRRLKYFPDNLFENCMWQDYVNHYESLVLSPTELKKIRTIMVCDCLARPNICFQQKQKIIADMLLKGSLNHKMICKASFTFGLEIINHLYSSFGIQYDLYKIFKSFLKFKRNTSMFVKMNGFATMYTPIQDYVDEDMNILLYDKLSIKLSKDIRYPRNVCKLMTLASDIRYSITPEGIFKYIIIYSAYPNLGALIPNNIFSLNVNKLSIDVLCFIFNYIFYVGRNLTPADRKKSKDVICDKMNNLFRHITIIKSNKTYISPSTYNLYLDESWFI